MIPTTGKVGTSLLADGTTNEFRLERQGSLVVTQLHGQYYEQGFRGNCFIVSTPAAGVTVPIYTNAVQQFLIYNPISSNVNISILKVWIGYVSGTLVSGHYCYAASTAQGLPTTATQALTQASFLKSSNSLSSGAGSNGLYFSPASPATALVANNYLRPLGVSQGQQASTNTNAPWTIVDDVQGGIVVPPQGVFVVAANVAAASVSVISALVEEVPV